MSVIGDCNMVLSLKEDAGLMLNWLLWYYGLEYSVVVNYIIDFFQSRKRNRG